MRDAKCMPFNLNTEFLRLTMLQGLSLILDRNKGNQVDWKEQQLREMRPACWVAHPAYRQAHTHTGHKTRRVCPSSAFMCEVECDWENYQNLQEDYFVTEFITWDQI